MNKVKIVSFIVYNLKFGQKEGEEENWILFYHPETETKRNKKTNVGLFAAFPMFTQQFHPNKACEVVTTGAQKHIFLNPETDYWCVLTVASTDVNSTTEMDESLKAVFLATLRSWYSRWCMFYGSFTNFNESLGKLILMFKMRSFYGRMLTEHSANDIITVYAGDGGGVYYQQLTSALYLDFQSYVSAIHDRVPNVRHHLALLHDTSAIISSTLTRRHTSTLASILRAHKHRTSHSMFTARPDLDKLSILQLQHGRCVSGIFDGHKHCNQLYLGDDDKLQVIVYQAYKITVCLIVDKLEVPFTDTITLIDSQVGAHLATFSSRLYKAAASLHSVAGTSADHNHTGNAASSSSLNAGNAATAAAAAAATAASAGTTLHYVHHNKEDGGIVESTAWHQTPSRRAIAMSVVCNLHGMLNGGGMLTHGEDSGEERELICKVQNDYWVGAKSDSSQEVFVAGNSKVSNLISFSEEARKVVTARFRGISFTD